MRPRPLPLLLAALTALLTLLAPPSLVAAHELAPDVRSVLDAVTPEVPGFHVEVVSSIAPQLVASYEGDGVVVVLDGDGRPFLRFTPDGVDGDLGLASFYALNDPTGQPPPEDAVRDDADAGPVWSRVSATPAWGWFDHRMHPGQVEVPEALAGTDRVAELATWEVPLRVGPVADATPVADAAIAGRIVHQPVRGRFVASLDPLDVDGVEVTVLQGRVPGVFLANRSGDRVTVRGAAGEPFLVFHPDGRVEANEASPDWWAHARASTSTPLPDVPADATAPPVWRELSTSGALGWLVPAAAYPDEEPEDVTTPRVVVDWAVPLTVAGEATTLAGTTAWVPDGAPPEAATAPATGLTAVDVVAALAGLTVVGALVAVRRARARREAARTAG